ncbi:MAG: hypothetical protein IJH41_07190 [Eubacterium sp.]|nr:hypothetical protein [Eubacterium sp.]
MEKNHNDPITFEISEHLAVIAVKDGGWSKELNLVSWNGQQPPKFDIREWSPDHTKMSKGITLFDYEMRKVFAAYTKFCNARTVSEGRHNRNAAAEAGLRAGQEAARQQEEANKAAQMRSGYEAGTGRAAQVRSDNEAEADKAEWMRSDTDEEAKRTQEAAYEEDDFDAPGNKEIDQGRDPEQEEDPEQNMPPDEGQEGYAEADCATI